jgi:hypothetical protein
MQCALRERSERVSVEQAKYLASRPVYYYKRSTKCDPKHGNVYLIALKKSSKHMIQQLLFA